MSNFFLITAIGLMILWATRFIKRHIEKSIALQHKEMVGTLLQEKTAISAALGVQNETTKVILDKVADALNAISQFNDVHDESMRIYGRNNEIANMLLLSAFQFILFDIQDAYAEDDQYEVAFDIQKLLDEIQTAINTLSNFYKQP